MAAICARPLAPPQRAPQELQRASARHPAEGVVFLLVAGSHAKLLGTTAFAALRKDSFIDVGQSINDLAAEASDEVRCADFAHGLKRESVARRNGGP